MAVFSDLALVSFWGKALMKVYVLLFKEFCLHKPYSTTTHYDVYAHKSVGKSCGLFNYGNY